MKRFLFAGLTASLSLMTLSAFGHEPERDFDVVDYPGATGTFISAVNDRGQVVGQYGDAAGVGHAFYGRPGHLRRVDPDGLVGKSAFSAAYTLNNEGVIGGSYSDNPGLGRGDHGYLLRHGHVETVQYPGGYPTEVFGINDNDQIIGAYATPDGNFHGFEMEDGVFKTQDVHGALTTFPLTINNRGQIVGFYLTAIGVVGQGYIREPDGRIKLFEAPGATPKTTQLLYINNRNDILGSFVDGSGKLINFLRSGREMESLTAPASLGANATFFQSINDHGDLSGFFSDAHNVFHGFVALPSH